LTKKSDSQNIVEKFFDRSFGNAKSKLWFGVVLALREQIKGFNEPKKKEKTMKKSLILLLLILPIMLMAFGFQGGKAFNLSKNFPCSSNWRMSEDITYYYDTDVWEPELKFNYLYITDNSDDLDKVTLMEWDDNAWSSYSTIIEYLYNAANKIEQHLLYLSMDGDMYLFAKALHEYDSQDRLLQTTMNVFDEWEGQWITMFRYDVTYGAGTTFTVDTYNLSDVYAYNHSTFEYDSRGRIVTQNMSVSPDSLNWEPHQKISIQYHPQDTQTGADMIGWIYHVIQTMLLYDHIEYPGMLSVVQTEEWDGAWVLTQKLSYNYDAQLRLGSIHEEFFYDSAMYFEYLTDYSYDNNGQNNLQIGKERSADETEWTLDGKHELFWEIYGTAIDDPALPPAQAAIHAYPTPFTDRLNIKTDFAGSVPLTVSIYNLKGQLLQSFTGNSGREFVWDASAQPSGIYFIRASQGSGSSVKKVLKLK